MRLSKYFKLNRDQPTLDFVDVDTKGDVQLYVDPKALRLFRSQWGAECISLVQDFFKTVIDYITSGNDEKAWRLLASLHEPNEVHLGLSREKAQGRALGAKSARNVWKSLKTSEAIRTGLLEDLEDTILMVEGIGPDIVSDILINIIRKPLIHYTQAICKYYSIPLRQGIESGPLWDPKEKEWYQETVEYPFTRYGKLLLIPKAIVRHQMHYRLAEYYRYYILPELERREKQANSELVVLLKNGAKIVPRRLLIAKYGQSKKFIIAETLKNPAILQKYREDKRKTYTPPLDHDHLAHYEKQTAIDWEVLLNQVIETKPGIEEASIYENRVEQLLSALLYPSLTYPQLQHEIHEGRKRIDITYTNFAISGFFHWLASNYPAMHVFVECKNYGREIGNPELDQLSGRFSPSRGCFGILVCRSFENKELFLKRCIDTSHDDRGYIIPIDDEDLINLVEIKKKNDTDEEYKFFKNRFDLLIM